MIGPIFLQPEGPLSVCLIMQVHDSQFLYSGNAFILCSVLKYTLSGYRTFDSKYFPHHLEYVMSLPRGHSAFIEKAEVHRIVGPLSVEGHFSPVVLKIFLFGFGFQQFDCNVFRCLSPRVYSTWGSLNFLNQFIVLHQIWGVLSMIQILFCSFIFLSFPSGTPMLCTCLTGLSGSVHFFHFCPPNFKPTV